MASTLSWSAVVRDTFLGNVYNENFENLSNGGLNCFKESSLGFKTVICLILVIALLVD